MWLGKIAAAIAMAVIICTGWWLLSLLGLRDRFSFAVWVALVVGLFAIRHTVRGE
jgi:hypothetical protein